MKSKARARASVVTEGPTGGYARPRARHSARMHGETERRAARLSRRLAPASIRWSPCRSSSGQGGSCRDIAAASLKARSSSTDSGARADHAARRAAGQRARVVPAPGHPLRAGPRWLRLWRPPSQVRPAGTRACRWRPTARWPLQSRAVKGWPGRCHGACLRGIVKHSGPRFHQGALLP